MRFDLLVNCADDEPEVSAEAAKFRAQSKRQMLLSENRRTGRVLIEAIGDVLPEDQIQQAAREQLDKRFYWLDPFHPATLHPEFIAHALGYYCFRAFNLADSIFSELRRGLGIDRYEVTLRLSDYQRFNPGQLATIEEALKKQGRFARVVLEPSQRPSLTAEGTNK